MMLIIDEQIGSKGAEASNISGIDGGPVQGSEYARPKTQSLPPNSKRSLSNKGSYNSPPSLVPNSRSFPQQKYNKLPGPPPNNPNYRGQQPAQMPPPPPLRQGNYVSPKQSRRGEQFSNGMPPQANSNSYGRVTNHSNNNYYPNQYGDNHPPNNNYMFRPSNFKLYKICIKLNIFSNSCKLFDFFHFKLNKVLKQKKINSFKQEFYDQAFFPFYCNFSCFLTIFLINFSNKEMRQGNPMYDNEPRNNYNQPRNQMNGQPPVRSMNYQYDNRYENENNYPDNPRNNGPGFEMPIQNGFYNNQRAQPHRKLLDIFDEKNNN